MPIYTEAVMLKMNRDFTVRTLLGYTIVFKKDQAILVAPTVIEDCMKYGAFPVKDDELKAVEAPPVKEALAGQERIAAIMEAMNVLVVKNDRGSFTANSSPHTHAISKIVGFEVKAKERDSLWDKLIKKDAEAQSN